MPEDRKNQEAEPRAGEAGQAGGGAAVPPQSGDSPKPHGDKLGGAVREATETPSEKEG